MFLHVFRCDVVEGVAGAAKQHMKCFSYHLRLFWFSSFRFFFVSFRLLFLVVSFILRVYSPLLRFFVYSLCLSSLLLCFSSSLCLSLLYRGALPDQLLRLLYNFLHFHTTQNPNSHVLHVLYHQYDLEGSFPIFKTS